MPVAFTEKHGYYSMKPSANLQPIGIFDSGMGGLTVLRELMEALPNESFLYLGDTARLPYGTKSQATVLQYALKMTALLVARGIKCLVIACNTATASALPHLQKTFPDLPIIGVVEPGVMAAVQATRNQHIALLATETTIHSQIYQNSLLTLNPQLKVISRPCGLFVALAEEGCLEDDIASAAIEKYLRPLLETNSPCDTIILGCTHFPALITPIQKFFSNEVCIINSGAATAATMAHTLKQLNLYSPATLGTLNFLVTDLPERFCRIGQLFLGKTIDPSSVSLIDHDEVSVTRGIPLKTTNF